MSTGGVKAADLRDGRSVRKTPGSCSALTDGTGKPTETTKAVHAVFRDAYYHGSNMREFPSQKLGGEREIPYGWRL